MQSFKLGQYFYFCKKTAANSKANSLTTLSPKRTFLARYLGDVRCANSQKPPSSKVHVYSIIGVLVMLTSAILHLTRPLVTVCI
jgi:hypothetical protein